MFGRPGASGELWSTPERAVATSHLYLQFLRQQIQHIHAQIHLILTSDCRITNDLFADWNIIAALKYTSQFHDSENVTCDFDALITRPKLIRSKIVIYYMPFNLGSQDSELKDTISETANCVGNFTLWYFKRRSFFLPKRLQDWSHRGIDDLRSNPYLASGPSVEHNSDML